MPTGTVAYPFTPEFQLRLLAVPIYDREFLRLYAHVFMPTYFSSSPTRAIATVIAEFFERYHTVPSRDMLGELVDEHLVHTQEKDAVRQGTRDIVMRVLAVPLTDLAAVKERTIAWAQSQAIAQAAMQMATLHEEWQRSGEVDIKAAEAIMRRTLAVGMADQRFMALDYFEDLVPRMYRDSSMFKIPTSYATLDAALEGGLDRGELGVFIGAPSMGKSAMLVGVARGALIHRHRTAVVTNEISPDKWAQRLDRAVTGRTREQIRANRRAAVRHIRKLRQIKGGLRILGLPSGAGTIEDVQVWLDQLAEVDNFVPDVLIVDYADELTVRSRSADDLRLRAIDVYRNLRALAQRRDIPIWTATQANRGAVNKATVTIKDLAEAFAKAAISDVMIAICQTEEEAVARAEDNAVVEAGKPLPKVRLFGAKNREGKRHFMLPYYFLPDRGTIVPNEREPIGHQDTIPDGESDEEVHSARVLTE